MIPGTLLRDLIEVEPYLGDTSVGPSYSTAVEYRGKLEYRTRLIRRPNGDEVSSTVTAFVRYPSVIALGDRVTVDGDRFEVLDVRKHRLRDRCSHLEVMLG